MSIGGLGEVSEFLQNVRWRGEVRGEGAYRRLYNYPPLKYD